MNSTDYPECCSCKHQQQNGDLFCIMFKDKPYNLPCAQHDQFAKLRKSTGRLIARSPLILVGMVEELRRSL